MSLERRRYRTEEGDGFLEGRHVCQVRWGGGALPQNHDSRLAGGFWLQASAS